MIKKKFFTVLCLVALLLYMSAVLFGCAEPDVTNTLQSDSTDIDISVSDIATQQSDSSDIDISVTDVEPQQSDSSDVNITVSDDDTKHSQPVVTVKVELPPRYYTTQQDREKFCGMEMCIEIDRKTERFVECVLQVTYDPDVLECADFLCPITDLMKLIREVTVQEPGKILITVSPFGLNYTDPICFHVLSNEEINFDVSLVSYTDESGVRENAQLVVDMPVKVPVVKDRSNN